MQTSDSTNIAGQDLVQKGKELVSRTIDRFVSLFREYIVVRMQTSKLRY